MKSVNVKTSFTLGQVNQDSSDQKIMAFSAAYSNGDSKNSVNYIEI